MEIPPMLPLLTTYILLTCILPVSLCSTIILPPICNGPNYTTGSTFESNLQHLLTGLGQNGYFYNATYGEAPDQVYGFTMCYADVSSEACNSCLFEAVHDITVKCPFKKNGAVWYVDCMIQYSDVTLNTSNKGELSTCEAKLPPRKSDSLAEVKKFRVTLLQLFDGLATNASRSPLRLAAGKMNYTSSANIYALSQCTRQLLSDECRMCLSNVTDFGENSSCTGRDTDIPTDVDFRRESCYVRFALKPFYVISEAQAPWSNCSINCSINSSQHSRETISTYVFTIVIGCLLVLVADIHL